jgi:hypothetical protein
MASSMVFEKKDLIFIGFGPVTPMLVEYRQESGNALGAAASKSLERKVADMGAAGAVHAWANCRRIQLRLWNRT